MFPSIGIFLAFIVLTPSSNARPFLNIYFLTSDKSCYPEASLFNYTKSAIAAVNHVLPHSSENNSNSIWVRVIPKAVSGCTLQDSTRAAKILQVLKNIKVILIFICVIENATKFPGYSALLGPPLLCDCHLVNQWITAGSLNDTESQRIYQINYYCYNYGGISELVSHVNDDMVLQTNPTIVSVSVVIPRMTHYRGLISYLHHVGWQRVALFSQFESAAFSNAELLRMSSLSVTVIHECLELEFFNLHLNADANITKSLSLIQDNLDALLIFAKPSFTVKLLINIQNLTQIKEGRIAIIQINMLDMLTYDSLIAWKSALTESGPTFSAGRSLMIFTALPTGTDYIENDPLYDEEINLSVAHAAALATRMAQLNVANVGGNFNCKKGLFSPIRTNARIIVPTLPGIEFTYTTNNGSDIRALFDMFILTLKPSVTDNNGDTLRSVSYTDVFQLVAVIRHPLILPQMRNSMNWPGDGKGPLKTICLRYTCPHVMETLNTIFFISAFGFAIAILFYLSTTYVYKARCINSQKLIFLESDFVFKEEEVKSSKSLHDKELGFSAKQTGATLNSGMNTSLQTIMSSNADGSSGSGRCCGDRMMANRRLRSIAWLNGEPMRIKKLDLTHVLLRSAVVKYLAGLRGIRHENINTFMGCYMAPNQFGLVYDYCHRDEIWLAPELLRNGDKTGNYSRPGDVYAFAIIIHTVFYQCKPFGIEELTPDVIISRVKARETPPFRPRFNHFYGKDVPPAYKNILERSWMENPTLRPTFGELSDQIEYMTMGKKISIMEHITKMTEKYSTCLEEIVQQRMKELEEERRKKELLIHELLPPVVAESLKAGIAVAPEMYDEVSIYFSDIVGFTTISAMSTPLQVVDFLNDLYTIFDRIIANYDVYKVETIGDAYMVVSGLPIRNNRRHAGEVAMTALELLCACANFTIKHLPHVPLRLRIGLHTGPCVAGVVGLTMPRYCLFGDTVQQALKMESSGKGGFYFHLELKDPCNLYSVVLMFCASASVFYTTAFRIHISLQTKQVLDFLGGYHTEYRGPLEFEGGIKTTTYWLTSYKDFRKALPEPPSLTEVDMMNEDESCKQLMRKLETLSSDSDSQASKSFSRLIQKLQSLIPDFVIPCNLELIKQDACLPKGTKRKTRPSRQSNRSSALSKKSKRPKLSNSRVFSVKNITFLLTSYDSLFCFKSIGTTVSEIYSIPEEVSSPAAHKELNATYVRPTSNNSRSSSKPVDLDQSTLLVNTTKSINLTPQPVKEKTFSVTSDDIQSPPPVKKGRFQPSRSQNSRTESLNKLSLKDPPVVSVSQRKSGDSEMSFKRESSHVRSVSNSKDKSLPKASNTCAVQSSSLQENCSLRKSVKTDNQIVAESLHQSQNGSLGRSSKMDNRSVADSVFQKSSGSLRRVSKDSKSGRVETSFQRERGFTGDPSKTSKSLKSPDANAEIQISVTNEIPHTVEDNTEVLKGAINQEAAISEIMTEDEEEDRVVQRLETPAETPIEVPSISPVDVPSHGDAVATSSIVSSNKPPLVKSIFPFVASTPSVPQQHSTPWSTSKSNWLSRLGWMTASKVTAPTPVTTQTNAPKTSFQSQPVKVGKIKNVLAANNTSANLTAAKMSNNFVSGMKSSKPMSSSNFSLGSIQRPPTMSRFNNNLQGISKTNCPTIAEKSFGGGSVVHGASTAIHGSTTMTTGGRLPRTGHSIFSSKGNAEKERRERLLAEMAEKQERQREAQERKALEHKAKVKAANERRAAVRANAEALAKKQEAEKLKKVSFSLLAAKDKPLFNPLKPTIHSTAAPSTSHLVKQPFGNNSSNLPVSTSSSHTNALNPTTSTNYMKNFDFVKTQTLPPLPHATQVNQLKTQPPVISESPISYDLTGILDEYNSDSEDETRAKRRPIPSWARSDSPFLIEMISKAYRGELRWQNIFRPAEQVHFDDADLFSGYNFRTRQRGSSVVWISPSKQPHEQSSGISKSSFKSPTAT
ncbi:unnamed protein product [Rodentolepis nana]|uniref:guanylate cyclase n=1 Tax=Rodentolepis nana TaxID=102285 RepID=A0A0R3TKU4_RODNA|nr:unnamed protein product [Rodentolepis nana]